MKYSYDDFDYPVTFFDYNEFGDEGFTKILEYDNRANLIIPRLSADGKSIVFETHEPITTEGLNYVLVVDDPNYRRPGAGAQTGQGPMIFVAIGVVIVAIAGAVTLVLVKKKTGNKEE